MSDLKEKKIEGAVVYNGKLLEVHCDKVLCPNNHESTREYINKCKAACVIAETSDNKFILEKQFRYPFNDTLIEFPAGKSDENEDTLITATRELEEETGYKAENIEFLGSFYPSPAYTNEVIDLYYASNLTLKERHLDENEFVEVFMASYQEIEELILNNKITDGKTVTAFYLYTLKKMNKNN